MKNFNTHPNLLSHTVFIFLFIKNQESSDEQRVPAWIAALASIGGLLALVGLGVCIYKLKPDKATGTEPLKAKQRKRVKQKLNKVQTVEMTTVKPYS